MTQKVTYRELNDRVTGIVIMRRQQKSLESVVNKLLSHKDRIREIVGKLPSLRSSIDKCLNYNDAVSCGRVISMLHRELTYSGVLFDAFEVSAYRLDDRRYIMLILDQDGMILMSNPVIVETDNPCRDTFEKVAIEVLKHRKDFRHGYTSNQMKELVRKLLS